MKILITGGMGFIGSHLINLCIKKKYEVFVFDLKSENALLEVLLSISFDE